jgi:hypothetical protein
MFALISPIEKRDTGYRVAEVAEQVFDVAEPLFWVECPADMAADKFWYNPEDMQFYAMPEPEPIIVNPIG